MIQLCYSDLGIEFQLEGTENYPENLITNEQIQEEIEIKKRILKDQGVII